MLGGLHRVCVNVHIGLRVQGFLRLHDGIGNDSRYSKAGAQSFCAALCLSANLV